MNTDPVGTSGDNVLVRRTDRLSERRVGRQLRVHGGAGERRRRRSASSPRRDFRRYQPELRYSPRPRNASVHPAIRFRRRRRPSTPILENRAETQEFDITATPRRAAQRRQRRDRASCRLTSGSKSRSTISAGSHACRPAPNTTSRATRGPATPRTSASSSLQPRVEWGSFLSGASPRARARAWASARGPA